MIDNNKKGKKGMLGRIKANKGYFGIFVADSIEASAMAFAFFSLLSLPAAIAATALNLLASGITSYIMGPKKTSSDAADPAAPKTPFIKRVKSSPNIVFKHLKMTLDDPKYMAGAAIKRVISPPKIVWGYLKATFGDPKYVVGAASAGAGTNFFFQALVGIKSLLATHSIFLIGTSLGFTGLSLGVATAGIAVCAAVGAIGVYSIFAGNAEKWKAVSNFYIRTFRKGNPEAARGEDFLQRLTKFPHVQKFLNNKALKRIKDPLMRVLTTESSLFTISASSTVAAKRIATMIAAPHTIPSTLPAMVISMKLMAMPVWNLISVGRLTVRDAFHKRQKRADKKKQLSPHVAAAAPAQPALPSISLTNAFDKTAHSSNPPETPVTAVGPRMVADKHRFSTAF